MPEEREILDQVRSALHSEPRVRPTAGPLHLGFAEGDLTISGEVDHVAGKKLALEAAARVPGVVTITDRLHVRPATLMGDGALRDAVRDGLLEDPALTRCGVRVWVKGTIEIARAPAEPSGTIDVFVEDGIVTLDGEVLGLGLKRLAGVIAWWVPGSRDVINGIGVVPPEADSEAAVTDAVRQVLEKDPFVDAESIVVNTRGGVVYLDGTVPREAERKLAEDDAWYVFGIDRVVNRLDVRM
ncbi:MAG TPA: BON domain-containing protein [Acetobacteraceae bacterium]|nr:BON domain-containing protein [Acetobacteraceae bacterium]